MPEDLTISLNDLYVIGNTTIYPGDTALSCKCVWLFDVSQKLQLTHKLKFDLKGTDFNPRNSVFQSIAEVTEIGSLPLFKAKVKGMLLSRDNEFSFF